MKAGGKSALFVMTNLISVVILVFLLLLIKNVYTNPADLMQMILIFPASLILIMIGIGLYILSKSYPVPLLNRLLPFISVPALIGTTGFTTAKSGFLAGLFIAAALIIMTIFTTAAGLRQPGKSVR